MSETEITASAPFSVGLVVRDNHVRGARILLQRVVENGPVKLSVQHGAASMTVALDEIDAGWLIGTLARRFPHAPTEDTA